MKSFKTFFIACILIGSIALPMAVAIDFFWKRTDKHADLLMKEFNSRPIDVLFFGDSTIRFTGERDINRDGIDTFFQQRSGLSICAIASQGFSAILYSQYVRLLDATKYRPKLVIIPINLRVFSDSVAKRPSSSFPLRQIYTRYRASGVFAWRDYLQYRFLGLEDRLNNNWRDQPVMHGTVNLGTNSQILAASRIDEWLDYAPEREQRYARQLGIKFRYHYMMHIDSKDQMLGYLEDTLDHLKKLGIPVLLYLTPINVQDGERYVGTEFSEQVYRNVSVIKGRIVAHGETVIDLSRSLDPSFFIHKRDVFEHLNTGGREFVAQQVAQVALELLRKKP
jgi:hypothetical protein